MRFCAMFWPFPFLVRLGWATTTVPNPAPREAIGRAYVLRGQGFVFSRGCGVICDRLRRAGVWTEDLRCVGDVWARRHLLADRAADQVRGPLILIGHSYGAMAGLHTARRLAPLGLAVDLLVCVDVAFAETVPDGVRHAVHLYRSRRRIYPAGPLRLAPGSRAAVENIDLDAADSPIRPDGLHHLNITASPAVQDWIIHRALAAIADHHGPASRSLARHNNRPLAA
jgi:pimeloyl-ACP methyl ester carboxylesterase